MYSDLQYLEVPLPEDIQKMKGHGDFKLLQKVIDRRLKTNLPFALKKRLELEKKILLRIPEDYPYSWEEADEILRDNLKDYQEEELESFWEDNAMEWIYIDGRVHFHKLFLDNLVKTRPALAKRNLSPENQEDRAKNDRLLDSVIAKMKKNGEVKYHFRIRSTIRIAETAQRIGEKVQVHLPIPVEYAQVKHVRLLSVSPHPVEVASPDYPQRTVCFETTLEKNQEFSVEYEFETHMKYRELEPEKVMDAQPTFYTEELPPHIHFTPYLCSLAEEIVGDETNPLLKAQKIYQFVTSRVMYSFVRSYCTIEDLTSYVASGLKGDCGIQALLFITLCRISGVPARWQSGLYATPYNVGNHDWAQFYVAPYGWLFADCSFGGTAFRNGWTERRAFYFGHLDPFRIPAAAEFQHEFSVPTGHFRNDPYDNQDGEVAYSDKNLVQGEFTTTHEALEVKEIL
ncbi:MAG: transglutaminase-like domain-containing protein [Oscillospiraceae bacterium]|jgi:transglutaminase-like putative cysteine protease|nr:transglutaminase-like domain-containing protein [Oscillospiraceae bacterium]